MPEAVLSYASTRMFTDVRSIQSDLMEAYSDDISKYADDRIVVRTRNCFKAIPRILSEENKKFIYSKVNVDGGSGEEPSEGRKTTPKSSGYDYYAPALDWLSTAGMTLTCRNVTEPKSPLEGRVEPRKFKLYFVDSGLLLSGYDQSSFRDVMFGDPYVNAGALAENAVARAFTSNGRSLMYMSKDDPRLEVDFVTMVGGKVCCIEVKSGTNRECGSLNRLMKDYGTSGIMFETRNCFIDDKGVRHYPLFASSFMDAIDPKTDVPDDLSWIEDLESELEEGDTIKVRCSIPSLMTSVILVRMNTCQRYARVAVSRRDDGDMDVRIESDCENIAEYARRLPVISDMDVLDPGSGRIFDSEVRGPLTPTCLCPMGVIYAASMEMGLMTKRISETVSSDEIDLTHCMDDD